MTGTLLQKMSEIRTFITDKGFPDGIDNLGQKLLWAHSELGESIDEYQRTESFTEPNFDKMKEELIDVTFYILDILGILHRDVKPLGSIWYVSFAHLGNENYTDMQTHDVFLTIQSKLSYATNLYKKGKGWSDIEMALYDCLCVIASNVKEADELFDSKIKKNMERDFKHVQKQEVDDFDVEESLLKLKEDNPEAIVYRDLDVAYLGFIERMNDPTLACYSFTKIIEKLMKVDKMEYAEALEYYGYNIAGNWVGKNTPVLLYDMS